MIKCSSLSVLSGHCAEGNEKIYKGLTWWRAGCPRGMLWCEQDTAKVVKEEHVTRTKKGEI